MIGSRGTLRSFAALALLLGAALPAFADLDVRDRIGFGGRWVVGAPTPYTLTLSNSGSERIDVAVTVSTGASFGLHDFVHARVVSVDAGAVRDEVFLLDGPQPWRGSIHVEIEVKPTVPIHTLGRDTDRGTIDFDRPSDDGSQFTGIEFPTHVVGVISDPRSIVSTSMAKAKLGLHEDKRPVASASMVAVDVPDGLLRYAPLGLEGLEVLVVCDPDARTCAEPAALEGVLDWVALGGTLVVSLGEHAAEFAASPLAAHLPAHWTGAQRRPLAEVFAELGVERPDETAPGPWTELRPGDNADERRGTGPRGPLQVERRIGMGRIVLLPYDVRVLLGQAAAGGAPLNAACLGGALSIDVPATVPDNKQWEGPAFMALTESFASALKHGAFSPPPLALVVFGIIVYVVVVGPLDWFVLKRLKKERLTTLTFLGAVVAFTTLAFAASVLLFSSGARVNRIVVADLADVGREGRQVMRTIDIAGYYSPRGEDQSLRYESPTVLLNGSFPGIGFGGDVGSALPVTIAPGDPLRPDAVVQLPFRSQRVVRTHSVGTLGPTIEVEWDEKDARKGVRVLNGLPVDLDEVFVYVDEGHAYELGRVASGAQSRGGEFDRSPVLRVRPRIYDDNWGMWGRNRDVSREEMRRLLEAVSVGSFTHQSDVPGLGSGTPEGDEAQVLRKLGLSRKDTFAAGRDRALVVAFASAAPMQLPGSSTEGDAHVVIRKEVSKR